MFWIIALGVVLPMAYVRLAQSDPSRWHVAAERSGMGEMRQPGGYIWREVVQGDVKGKLQALDKVAINSPRTSRLAGSVEEGKITYITRSRVFGFPDYTTIGVYGGAADSAAPPYLEIYARLRFGKSDLGVNAKRAQGWLAAVQ